MIEIVYIIGYVIGLFLSFALAISAILACAFYVWGRQYHGAFAQGKKVGREEILRGLDERA